MKYIIIAVLFFVLVYWGDQNFGWVGVAGALGITGVAALLLFRSAKHGGGGSGGGGGIGVG